jgi:hypothetical protein
MNHLFSQSSKFSKSKLTPYEWHYELDWCLFYVVIFQLRKLHSITWMDSCEWWTWRGLQGSGCWLLTVIVMELVWRAWEKLLKTSDSSFGIWDLLNMVDTQLQCLVLPRNILQFFQGWTVDWADHGTDLLFFWFYPVSSPE